jgi:Holliday junction resolvase
MWQYQRDKELTELPREFEVEERVRKHLKEQGFTVIERTKKQGVDIQAIKDGKNYYIEVEGNTKPAGKPLASSQKYTHLLRAIGQICLRMNTDPEGVFHLALPEDEYYKEKVDKLQTSMFWSTTLQETHQTDQN